MGGILRFFGLQLPSVVVYMLQSTEYQVGAYLRWLWRTRDVGNVMNRRDLSLTKAARGLLLFVRVGIVTQAGVALTLLVAGLTYDHQAYWMIGIALLLTYPLVWSHVVLAPLLLARLFIVNPRNKRLIAQSKHIFDTHPATKIVIAGSYGKTTLKEILSTVLSEAKKVAATPGNRNVASSHAVFAAGLGGDEDILIIELGEGQPGDIVSFAETIHPDVAFITGIAPAHLDAYKTVEAAAEDIFSITQYVSDGQLYVNGDSVSAQPFIETGQQVYSSRGLGDWKVDSVTLAGGRTAFNLENGKQTLVLESGLLGAHLVGPLAAAAVLALELGLTPAQVAAGIAATRPHEHRMQPRSIHGALVIDDTYNGNIEGVRAGLSLLGQLPGTRKWYVTPGLVEQGPETASVHQLMGELIAAARPDRVVLMRNSVTGFIENGLRDGSYNGELTIEDHPLDFYTNLDQFVVTGDVVLMQNDWTDNYA